MASFFNSKVQKIKETLGAAQATTDPEEVQDVKEHLRSLRNHNSALSRYAKSYSADCDKSAQTGDKLGMGLVEYSKEYDQSPLGEALSRTGESQNALNALQQAFASQMTEILVAPLRRSNDEHIKKAVELKNKQEEARVAYDIVLSKQRELNSKRGDAKYQQRVEEADQAVNVAKAAYDTLNQQLVNRLNDFDLQNSKETITNLRAYMSAQLQYFSDAHELLNEMMPHINELEKRNNDFITQMKAQAASIANQPPPQAQPPAQQQQQQQQQQAPPMYQSGELPAYTAPPMYQSGDLPPVPTNQQAAYDLAYNAPPPQYAMGGGAPPQYQ